MVVVVAPKTTSDLEEIDVSQGTGAQQDVDVSSLASWSEVGRTENGNGEKTSSFSLEQQGADLSGLFGDGGLHQADVDGHAIQQDDDEPSVSAEPSLANTADLRVTSSGLGATVREGASSSHGSLILLQHWKSLHGHCL